jgi:hypothetical protein
MYSAGLFFCVPLFSSDRAHATNTPWKIDQIKTPPASADKPPSSLHALDCSAFLRRN